MRNLEQSKPRGGGALGHVKETIKAVALGAAVLVGGGSAEAGQKQKKEKFDYNNPPVIVQEATKPIPVTITSVLGKSMDIIGKINKSKITDNSKWAINLAEKVKKAESIVENKEDAVAFCLKARQAFLEEYQFPTQGVIDRSKEIKRGDGLKVPQPYMRLAGFDDWAQIAASGVSIGDSICRVSAKYLYTITDRNVGVDPNLSSLLEIIRDSLALANRAETSVKKERSDEKFNF